MLLGLRSLFEGVPGPPPDDGGGGFGGAKWKHYRTGESREAKRPGRLAEFELKGHGVTGTSLSEIISKHDLGELRRIDDEEALIMILANL